MKKLLKSLVICSLLAWVGSLTTSCVKDPTGPNAPDPVFEITGEPVIHNGVSVDIPVNMANLKKVTCYVREICVDEKGDKYFVTGYDENNQPIKGSVAAKPTPTIVSLKGTEKECSNGTSVIEITGNDGLDKNRMFAVYILVAVSDTEYYNNGEIFTVEFTTPDSYGEGDVNVIRKGYQNLSVAVEVPEHIKAAGRRIKWGVMNIAMEAYNNNPPIPESLQLCDWVYPASLIARDTILEINHYNAYRRNANGEVGYYIVGNSSIEEVTKDHPALESGSAGPIQYYSEPQPGEPLVLLMAEVDYADCALGDNEEGADASHKIANCDKKHPTINWGWGEGWYCFPYDIQSYMSALRGGDDGLPDMGVGGGSGSSVDPNMFWHEGAWYKRIEVRLPEPKKFNGTVNVKIDNISAQDASITLTPDDQTYMYFVGVFENTNEYMQGYADITRTYLNGDQTLWQWFTTSEIGSYMGVTFYYASEGPKKIDLSKYFVSIQAGTRYHVVVNAVGKKLGENGDYEVDITAQNFQHKTFALKNYTLPAPELEVVAAEPYSPWTVKYILRNPDWKNNPISKVAYVANYTREFEAYMKANDMTYTEMAMMNVGIDGYELSDTEIEMINSNAGAEVEFPVLANSEYTAAFIAWNSEGRASNPDSETYPGYAEAKSTPEQPAAPLDMKKLNALKGDWTATATVNYLNSETGEFSPAQHSWKVTIGDLTSPETMTQEAYDVFNNAGVSKEQADAYFAEFKQEELTYNEAVKGQNRVLCTGWQLDNETTLSFASPWDLFVMPDYSASNISYLFHDYGPKWFLQVNEAGEVFVPVNYNRIPPFTSWYNGMAHHFCMANYETQYAFPIGDDGNSVEQVGMPVEISDDGNTFTLKSTSISFYDVDADGNPVKDEQGNIIYTEVPFYPNIIYEGTTGAAFYNNHIISEVVLTRGWNGGSDTAAPDSNLTSAKRSVVTKVSNVTKPSTYKKTYSATALMPNKAKKVKATLVDAKQMTPEQTRNGMAKLLNKRNPARN